MKAASFYLVRSLLDVKHILQLKRLIAVLYLTADIDRRKKHKAPRALREIKRNKERKMLVFAGRRNRTEMQPWKTEDTLVK